MAPTITLTPELAYRSISLSTAFWDYREYQDGQSEDIQPSWEDSRMNPRNRINSLSPMQTPTWRIDGSTSLGTQFFTVPIFINPLPPLRVDAFIPDPAYWPAGLREDLDFDKSFLFRDARAVQYGVSQHILRALEHWSASISDFEKVYRELPFGSRIMFENMSKDIRKMRVRMIRTHDLERQLLPLASLRLDAPVPLPGTLDISQLTVIRQFQDSASLVRIVGQDEDDMLVFKTMSDTPKYMYHELETLLSMPEHPNIISRPRHVVTKRCRWGGKVAVLGFLIRYHKQGCLRDILASRRLHGKLQAVDQVKWCSQIVKALQHIKSNGPGWYCDLRLDNILLSDEDDVVLIDFEQRGVMPAFASPLENYLQYVNALILQPSLTVPERKEYTDIYELHIRPFVPARKDHHQGCVPWLCMSKPERDAAELYMLGRLVWCIFEGVSAPQKELWMEYSYEPDIVFPQFRCTPQLMRDLILRCTPDWKWVDRRLYREAFDLHVQDSNFEIEGERDVLFQMVKMWQEELKNCKAFLRNRGECREDTESWSGEGARLTLDNILQTLGDVVTCM